MSKISYEPIDEYGAMSNEIMEISIPWAENLYNIGDGLLHTFPHLILDKKISPDEFLSAVNTILTYMEQYDTAHISVDLKKRNKLAAPAKEMTMGEIEELLGHRVKIVKEKSK